MTDRSYLSLMISGAPQNNSTPKDERKKRKKGGKLFNKYQHEVENKC